jgi:hypothetical protein
VAHATLDSVVNSERSLLGSSAHPVVLPSR